MKFTRRHLVIRTMEANDVVDYYYEFPRLSKTERSERIKKRKKELASMESDINSKVIFSVIEKDSDRLIGVIYAERKKMVEEITVSIPNETKLLRYGFEVIDQFLKISKEQWAKDIKFIKLNKDDAAAKIYLKEKNMESEYISVS